MWSSGARQFLLQFTNKNKTTALITSAAIHSSSIAFGIDSPAFNRGFQIVNIAHDTENRILTVKWNDGKIGRYPYVWLRDTSPDPSTYTISDSMTCRNLFMSDFDVEVVPKSTLRTEDGSEIKIEWPCGTVSHFRSDWLRTRNLNDPETHEWRKKVYLNQARTWGSEELLTRLKRFHFKSFMESDKTLHDFLEAVCIDGIAFMSGSPTTNGKADRGAIEKIGERIGFIRESQAGLFYEVTNKADPSYMSNTPIALALHTDLPSLANDPEVQLTHMIERAETGGDSLFTDGFRVAEQLKSEAPDVYKLLTTVSLEYIEEGFDKHVPGFQRDAKTLIQFDRDMTARHKIITLDDNGQPAKICFANDKRSWFFDTKLENILPMYRAMKTFNDYCYQPRNLVHLPLENGDVVLYANNRLLHGRTSFKSFAGGARTLEGCYFDWDVVRSKVRVLRDRLNLPENQPSA